MATENELYLRRVVYSAGNLENEPFPIQRLRRKNHEDGVTPTLSDAILRAISLIYMVLPQQAPNRGFPVSFTFLIHPITDLNRRMPWSWQFTPKRSVAKEGEPIGRAISVIALGRLSDVVRQNRIGNLSIETQYFLRSVIQSEAIVTLRYSILSFSKYKYWNLLIGTFDLYFTLMRTFT